MLRRCLPRRLGMGYYVPALPTPNPDCLQFRCEQEDILPTAITCNVPYKHLAMVHPLANVVFDQYEQEVRSVFLAQKYVTITKWSDVEWSQALERGIGGLIGSYLLHNEPMAPSDDALTLIDDADSTKVREGDSEIVQCLKELLREQIRPMVQRDGGDVKFLSFDAGTGVVSVSLLGACQTCPSAPNTLKEGIERMMKHFVEEVTEVVEVKEPVVMRAKDGTTYVPAPHPRANYDEETEVHKAERDDMLDREERRKQRLREVRRRGGSKAQLLMGLEEMMEPEA